MPGDQQIRVSGHITKPTTSGGHTFGRRPRSLRHREPVRASRRVRLLAFSDNKTVIRGGFGIFYDHPEGNVLGNGINSQGFVPWSQSASISGTNAALSQFDAAPGPGSVPAPSTLSLSGVDPNLVVARSYQYSFGVQHELPEGMLHQVS